MGIGTWEASDTCTACSGVKVHEGSPHVRPFTYVGHPLSYCTARYFTVREAKLAFIWSRMLQIDESSNAKVCAPLPLDTEVASNSFSGRQQARSWCTRQSSGRCQTWP